MAANFSELWLSAGGSAANVPAVLARFHDRGIAAADIGEFTADQRVVVGDGAAEETIWDFAREPLIGCVRSEAVA